MHNLGSARGGIFLCFGLVIYKAKYFFRPVQNSPMLWLALSLSRHTRGGGGAHAPSRNPSPRAFSKPSLNPL